MSQPRHDSLGADADRDRRDDADPAGPDFAAARSLKRQLLEELRTSWQGGQSLRAEDLLPRWPGNPDDDPDVASILFEEYCQRREQGGSDRPEREEFEQRFPSQKDSLARLFRQHEVLRSLAGASGGSSLRLALPGVGDELFGFRLREELGRGAFARVFLAEQAALAGRPVVVKVSAIEGEEPQTLAQLQHTNIVPIYSVHEDARAGVRAVCMPYFGGASLSRVLEVVWSETGRPTSGARLVDALALVGGPPPAGRPGDSRLGEPSRAEVPGPARLAGPTANGAAGHLAGLSYVRATAWILARLAEGLQHAHERGVLHSDIKPSNVLLGADGQPMLLDFNLAQKLQGDHCRAQATLGGTVAYMAPEHLRALATRDPALARQVDQRADVYGLGMVLFEMLTGERPFDQSASYSPMPAMIEAMAVERGHTVPSLRRLRPDVPWGLESIARKCLAPDPAQRYQRAADLAADLHRFLNDQPLRHAPELSVRERARKWVRSHPRLAAAGTVSVLAAVVLLLGAGILAGVQGQLRREHARAEAARRDQALQRKAQFEAGAVRSLCLVNTTADLADHVRQGLPVCEKTLSLYGVLDRDDWAEHPDWQALSPPERGQLAADVRELLLLLARARVDVASRRQPASKADVNEALRSALALLDRAAAIPGLPPSAALWEDRARYHERLGEAAAADDARQKARALPPVSARDHYLLATTHAGRGRYAEAVAELNRALAKNPRHYWSWFQRGLCFQESGDHFLALGDFSACVALWPEFAWGYFNRARVLHQLGKSAEARADYSAALERDPGLVYAYLNRGLVGLDLGQHEAALADFDAAAARGRDDVVVHAGRGIALEHLGRHREADAAFARAWRRDAGHTAMLLGYGFAVCHRLPDKARDAFQTVLAREPRNPRALYGQALLFSNRERGSAHALFFFNQALEADPTFSAARRGRALVLAYRGEGPAARQEIELCVASDPAGVTLYAAACVYALSAAGAANEVEAKWTADRSLAFLREAFARGYGRDRAAKDDDLKSIRQRREFRELLQRR